MLVVADVRFYRDLLTAALADDEAIELAGSAPHDVAPIASSMADPDVLVVDATSLAGPESLRTLAALLPDTKIVVLGAPGDDDAVVELLELGAAGYVTADQQLSDVVDAIEAAAHGELPCPPRISAALARRLAALAPERRDGAGAADGLTPRQREIATLVAEGLSNKQIARRLSIERATVKNHVHSILLKLGVSRRDQVAARLDGR